MRCAFFLAPLCLLVLFACAIGPDGVAAAPLDAPWPGAPVEGRPYAAAPTAMGQGVGQVGEPPDDLAVSQFLTLFPELRREPAPGWLRPGVRLTYNFGFATFARERDDPTPAGAGVVQYDVIAQDRRSVVVQRTLFSTEIRGQPPAPLGAQVAMPGVGEVWFAPGVLPAALEATFDGFTARRMAMEVEGETYDVVRMQTTTGNAVEVWAFEAATGVMVFHSQARYGNDGEQESGNVTTLVGRRQVRLPWRFGSVPRWVKAGVELDFSGSQMMDFGGPPYVPLPMAVRLRVGKVGSLWSEYGQTAWLNGRQVGTSSGATGVAQIFGGMWLPPEALGVLAAGAVLDRDPLTGVVTRVDEVTAQRIAVSAEGPGHLTRYTYRAADGRLVGYYQEAHMTAGVQYTELAGE
jgi:hypothetical protein